MTRLSTGEFYGEVRGRLSAREFVLTGLRHQCGRRLPLHTHDAPYYSLLMRGGYRESWRGGEIEYRPLTLVFHPPETSHIDEVAPGGGIFFLIELRQSWIDDVSSAATLRMPRIGVQDPDLVWLALRLYREYLGGDSLMIESLLLELYSRTATVTAQETNPPPWLPRIVELIRTCFSSSLTVEALAREAGVHPVHLTRVFRRQFGMTVGEYVRRVRIEFAARNLARGPFPLADLAQAAGFADQSHFTRVMKQVTGSTPGELAALLRAERGRPARRTTAGSAAFLRPH